MRKPMVASITFDRWIKENIAAITAAGAAVKRMTAFVSLDLKMIEGESEWPFASHGGSRHHPTGHAAGHAQGQEYSSAEDRPSEDQGRASWAAQASEVMRGQHYPVDFVHSRQPSRGGQGRLS